MNKRENSLYCINTTFNVLVIVNELLLLFISEPHTPTHTHACTYTLFIMDQMSIWELLHLLNMLFYCRGSFWRISKGGDLLVIIWPHFLCSRLTEISPASVMQSWRPNMAELCSTAGAVLIVIAAQTLRSRKTKRAFRSITMQAVEHACSIDVSEKRKMWLKVLSLLRIYSNTISKVRKNKGNKNSIKRHHGVTPVLW